MSSTRIGSHWPELTVLLGGQLVAGMAIAIVSVAAPAISQDLHIVGGTLQMAVSGFGLASGVLLVTGARLGDWEHRRVFLIGVALFTVAGLASGLAPGPAVLVVGQLLQGTGAAMLIPQVLSLIQLRFSGAARSRAVSLYSMTLGFGVASGLLLSGLLISVNPLGLSWRPVFLVNVPIGLLLLVGGWLRLPRGGTTEHSPLDRWGTLVFVTAVALLVVPLTFGPSTGWPLWTWVMLVCGMAGLIVFMLVERGVTHQGGQPLLELGLLRIRGVIPGLFVMFATMGGYGALIYTMSAYMQVGLGYGVLRSGTIFAAYAIGFGLVNLTWFMLPERLHPWVSPVALAMLCLAEAVLGIIVRHGFPLASVVPLLVVAGAGHGAGFGALVAHLTAHLPSRYASAASGLINTTIQLASSVGIAALGSAFLSAVQSDGQAGYGQAMSMVLFALAAVSSVAIICALAVSLRLRGTPTSATTAEH